MAYKFSASRAAQLMTCPGSADLEKSIPGWVAPVVDESAGRKGQGSFMHGLLEQSATLTPRDMEHLAEAMMYVAQLRRTRRFKILTEQVQVAEWLPSKPQTTPDVVLYTTDELHIIDYKAGKILVETTDNVQGLFLAMTHAHLSPKAKGVTFHIVQPWAGNIDSWFIDIPTLLKFRDEAIDIDNRILAGDTTLVPSDNCKFCPAYPHSRGDKGSPLCPAAMRVLYPMPGPDEDAILDL